MLLNAHECVGCFQTMYWNEWKAGDILEFILVDYFKAPVYREGNGMFQIYYAVCRKDYPKLGMKVGDDIFLHIAYRALKKALEKVPMEIKMPCLKENADGQNLFIRIERKNDVSIKVHYEEPREPTTEHKANSKKYYQIIHSEFKHNER